MSDSFSLLETRGSVTVLTIGEQALARPVEEVVTHLERHGISATAERIAADPSPVRALVACCRDRDPCLLVMGAYEHSKFREDFPGGVTAMVLRGNPIPVLLSH